MTYEETLAEARHLTALAMHDEAMARWHEALAEGRVTKRPPRPIRTATHLPPFVDNGSTVA